MPSGPSDDSLVVEQIIRRAQRLSFDDRKKIVKAISKPSREEYSEVKRRAIQTRWARRNQEAAA
jgi:hypothetical protein